MGKLSVALQLYSVRDFAEKDLKGTLAKVKEIGYGTVELAGLYGKTPEEFKAALDEAGLTALSAHVPFNEMQADAAGTVARYKAVGCRYLAVPWLGQEFCPGGENFDTTLSVINEIGKLCGENGMTLLYHNHDFEFKKLPDGTFALDYLYATVPSDILQTEIDTCWVNVAGQDPAAYVRKYAGRCPIVHLKDYAPQLTGAEAEEETPKGTFEFKPVGFGVQDFPAIVKAAGESGADWVVVEQDSSVGISSIEAARLSIEYLKGLI